MAHEAVSPAVASDRTQGETGGRLISTLDGTPDDVSCQSPLVAFVEDALARLAAPDPGNAEVAEQPENLDRGHRAIMLPRGFRLLDKDANDGSVKDFFAELLGADWRFTSEAGWFSWVGTHWRRDESLGVRRLVDDFMVALNQHAESEHGRVVAEKYALTKRSDMTEADKRDAEQRVDFTLGKLNNWLKHTERTAARVGSVVTLLEAELARPIRGFDDGDLLNLANGTLDLATLQLRKHRRGDMLTHCLNYGYDPAATCSRWESFLLEVLGCGFCDDWHADDERRDLLQEAVGYSLTPDTSQETAFLLTGSGANGKSTLIRAIAAMLGDDLARAVDLHKLGQPGDYQAARLSGVRVIFSSEGRIEGTFSENTFKQLVSGDALAVRQIYHEDFELRPTCKVWWATNYLPRTSDTSESLYRRLKIIRFERHFDEVARDPGLADKLIEELPGILNWALAGLQRLRQNGRFTSSTAVTAEVAQYRNESNAVGLFLEECTTAGGPTSLKTLYGSYATWCKSNGRQAPDSLTFGRELTALGVVKRRAGAGMVYMLNMTG